MEVNGHGGQCCGITCVSGFEFEAPDCPCDDCQSDYEQFEADFEEILLALESDAQFLETMDERHRLSHLVEIVLTDGQLKAASNEQLKALKDAGFKVVARFENGNSGNMCNILHWCLSSEDTSLSPFNAVK